MGERPFKEKSHKPTEEQLNTVLGNLYTYFVDLKELTKGFKHEWNYSKTSGWIEKVADKKKALYYLIPLNDAFILSMAIRENEKEYFESEAKMEKYKEIVSSARKYTEGYNVKFEVTDADTYDLAKEFIENAMAQR